jgi:transposase-like protein
VAAAKAFFAKAIRRQGRTPKTITLDGYAASHRALREMKADELLPKDTTLRSSKYLNNLIEQDHRNIKSRVNTMLGFKKSPEGRRHDLGHRTDASHSKSSVRSHEPAPQRYHRARRLEGSPFRSVR